ncbi:MAG TPA: inositol monophosphatase family protein [Candidatus Dormibacteraeota bacterium]|nr:inositol monophosphatase family protein [Candidatus Dormibacteraeota bacterium]
MSIAHRKHPDPLRLAIETAREAGAALLEAGRLPLDIRQKDRRADIVTSADRASEAIVIARIREAYPDAAILAEESGASPGSSDERWIIDPLDGTTNFAHGYPIYCVSIAYERAGELLAGAIYAPALDECFAAERGGGATLNGKPIRVSTIDAVGDAMVCTGFHPADYARNGAHFGAISQVAQAVRRDGSAALDLAYVACGRFDGFWEFDLHAWDVAAGTLIVREAGGRVTQLGGATAALDASSILATNGRIHAGLDGELARAGK